MPRGLVPAGALLLALGCPSTPKPPAAGGPQHPNILVLVPDSLRADRVGTDTPGFAALAKQGCAFEHAISQSGWTLPALATMLTGQYPLLPSQNQARMSWIDPGHRTLPEILGMYGYHSVAWWGGNLGSMAEEFSRGFTELRGDEQGDPILGDSADVQAWLEDEPPEPFFAFVHDVDLQFVTTREQLAQHWPSAAEHIEVKPDKSFWTGVGLDELYSALAVDRGRKGATKPAIAAYDAVVHSYGERVAATIDTLEATGLADRTVVVLISPHGVHLGEGGSFRHGTLDEPDLRIPFIISRPGQAPCLRDATVETLDLAPTLLTLSKAPADHSMGGRSLAPLLDAAPPAWEEPDVFSMNSRVELSLTQGEQKLEMLRPPPGLEGHQPLYRFDLPGQDRAHPRRPVPAEELPAEAAVLLTRLEAFRAQHAGAPDDPAAEAQPADALRQALQDRGYWEHVQDPNKPPDERRPGL